MFEENSEREREREERKKKAVLSHLKFGIHFACYTAIMKTKVNRRKKQLTSPMDSWNKSPPFYRTL